MVLTKGKPDILDASSQNWALSLADVPLSCCVL